MMRVMAVPPVLFMPPMRTRRSVILMVCMGRHVVVGIVGMGLGGFHGSDYLMVFVVYPDRRRSSDAVTVFLEANRNSVPAALILGQWVIAQRKSHMSENTVPCANSLKVFNTKAHQAMRRRGRSLKHVLIEAIIICARVYRYNRCSHAWRRCGNSLLAACATADERGDGGLSGCRA